MKNGRAPPRGATVSRRLFAAFPPRNATARDEAIGAETDNLPQGGQGLAVDLRLSGEDILHSNRQFTPRDLLLHLLTRLRVCLAIFAEPRGDLRP